MTEIKKEDITINEFIEVIINLDRRIIMLYQIVIDNKWNELSDSRSLLLKSLHEINFSTILSLSVLAESHKLLNEQSWWLEKFNHLSEMIKKEENFADFSTNRQNYLFNYLKDNYILNFYYEFEAKIRNFVRELKEVKNLDNRTKKKKQYLNGNESFYFIELGFFIDYLGFTHKDIEVLQLYSPIRNTIHNTGFFYSTTEQNLAVKFKDRTYDFIHEEPIDFIDFTFIEQLLSELVTVIEKILKNKLITAISEIQDPISRVTFSD